MSSSRNISPTQKCVGFEYAGSAGSQLIFLKKLVSWDKDDVVLGRRMNSPEDPESALKNAAMKL